MRGGMRRTIQFSCGQIICGHPNEVNAKYERHIRCCNECKEEENQIKKMPKFDGVAGYNNGWKGLTNQGKNRPKEMTTAVSCEGMMFYATTPCNSIASAMDMMNEPEYKAKVLNKHLGGLVELKDKESMIDKLFEFKKEIDRVDCSLRCWKKEYTKELMMTWTTAKIEMIFNLMKKELGDLKDELVKEDEETEKGMKELVALLKSQGKEVEIMYI